MSDIVYIELNHWSPSTSYPDCEPYLTWMRFFSSEMINGLKKTRL